MTASQSSLPVFIVGAWHSGTYLMVDILSKHSDVLVLRGETHYFLRKSFLQHSSAQLPELERWLFCVRALLDLGSPPTLEHSLQEELAGKLTASTVFQPTDLDGMFNYLITELCADLHKNLWVEKTPSHIAYLQEIKKSFPSAIIIHMIRDPRAVLASTKIRSKVAGGDQVIDIYHPLHESITWRESIRLGRQFAEGFPGSFLEVRYEDLILKSKGTVEDVCTFLGIPFQPEMLDIRQVNAARQEEQGVSGFDQRPLERWKGRLNSSETFILAKVCSKEIGELGYDISTSGFPIWGLLFEFAKLPLFFIKKLQDFFRSSKDVKITSAFQRLLKKYGPKPTSTE